MSLCCTSSRHCCCCGSRIVVITEPAWEGWRVYIDDHRVEHFFANTAFIGVYVPAGGHRIRLTCLPESFGRGRAISRLPRSFSSLAASSGHKSAAGVL
jgi:hypothetical protein